MKKFTVILALTFFAAMTIVADDNAKGKEPVKTKAATVHKNKKTQSTAPDQKDGSPLTGSNIKQDVRRHGRITDGAHPLTVIDRESIERSGASDLKQLLTQQGIH